MADAVAEYDPTTLPVRLKVATMASSLLGILLAALDQTVVATAGPAMQRDLHIAPALYAWMTTSYIVASTVTVPLWGKLSDLFGRKRTLIIGMVLFLIGSALCAAARSLETLILYRVIQGIGSAALFTNAFAVTADLFPPKERSKWQGLFGGVFGLASVIGPFVGGALTDAAGWHWVFLINLPLGALALAVAMARMPPLRRPRTGPARVDVTGAAVLIVAMVALLLGLSLGHGEVPPGGRETGWPWASWQIASLFAVAVIGVIAFIIVEGRVREPLLDLSLFRRREFAIGCAAAFMAGLPFVAAIVFLPLFMVDVLGASATDAGKVLIPLTLGIVFANIASGQIVSRIGRYKGVILCSLVLSIIGFAVMGVTLSTDSTTLGVSLKMIILGMGMGPAIPLYTLAIQNSVPIQQIGVATSTAVFARSVGATVGLAVLNTVFAMSLVSSMRGGAAFPVALTDAVRLVFQVSAVLCTIALLITLVLPALPLRKHQAPPPAME